MSCLPTTTTTTTTTEYDQDFYGVFIQELNETLHAPRLNMTKYPACQVPMMFWTDHDCYLLMELARTSPDMIDILPRLKVASDPASTDFFYERLRAIAHAARLEAATCGGNYAVIRQLSEDIAHKVPMPWHAPGWEIHCKVSEALREGSISCPLKTNLWPLSFPPPQQQQQSLQQHHNHQPQRLQTAPSNSPYLQGYSSGGMPPSLTKRCETSYAQSSFTSIGTSAFSLNNDGSGLPEIKPGPLNEELLRSQDEFFMGPSRCEPWASLITQQQSVTRQEVGRGRILGGTSQSTWPPQPGESPYSTDFRGGSSAPRCGQGRYWPRQFTAKESNSSFENSQAPKMGQQFPGYVVRASKPFGSKNHYYCKIHGEESEPNSPPSTPKETYLCVFCKGNNEPEAIYKSHPLRLNNIVICPSLRNYTCCICKATGDNAHTIKYCPYNKRGYFATRSHEKCNSNNNSRLKMKVQIIEDAPSPPPASSLTSRHDEIYTQNYPPIRHRSCDNQVLDDDDDEDDDEVDEDEEEPDHIDNYRRSSSPMKLIISVEKQGSCKYGRA